VNLVTPTAVAKFELLFNRLTSEDGLLNILVGLKEHVVTLVTPTAVAKLEICIQQINF
jgi:hypothetical protein